MVWQFEGIGEPEPPKVEIFGQKSKRADPAAKSSFEQQTGRQGHQQNDQPGRVHMVENPANQPVLKADQSADGQWDFWCGQVSFKLRWG